MDRRTRRGQETRKEESYFTWVTWILILVGAITFMVSYTMYGKKIEQQARIETIGSNETNSERSLLNMNNSNELTEVNLGIGKTVNELEQETAQQESSNTKDTRMQNEEKQEKIAVNTSAIEQKQNVIVEEETDTQEKQEEPQQVINDPTFVKPVEGEILKNYSSDTLLYSETLEEWTTHLGVDYKAEKTSIVKAVADGKIKTIKNDPRYGLTIVIEHENGFTSMYANLLSSEFVVVGEEVIQGQTIATVGNTAAFEIADETHLHFELMKDGVHVDPNLYLK